MLLENPKGNLQHRPFMHQQPFELGLEKRRVDYCAYDHPFKKPTHVWTNLSWEQKGTTGDGLCGGKCGHGKVQKNGRFKHFCGLAQEPERGPRGFGANKLKNSVPDGLCSEWMDLLVANRKLHPEQDTVIDLCAGYQHMKDWCLKNGFNYIAIDMLGDRNLKRRAIGLC